MPRRAAGPSKRAYAPPPPRALLARVQSILRSNMLRHPGLFKHIQHPSRRTSRMATFLVCVDPLRQFSVRRGFADEQHLVSALRPRTSLHQLIRQQVAELKRDPSFMLLVRELDVPS
jgi:hypothetical protein